MWKAILLILFAIGAVLVYQHQDQILQKVENYLKNEKTISKVNAASEQKEKYIMDAQQNVEY